MKPTHIHSNHQKGQAILLIAILMVALLASLGLAIDGGGMFLLYRDVQNATDAAALSAAFALCTGNNPTSAAEFSAELNGFVDKVDGATVTISNPPTSGIYAGNSIYVSIEIQAEKPSYFIQVVYTEPLTVSATTIAQCQPSSNFGWPESSSVISLSQDCAASSGGANTAPMRVTGGGTYSTVGGGIYVNSSNCPADATDTNGAGSSINAGGYGVCAHEDIDLGDNVTATEGGTLTYPCPEYPQIIDTDPYVTAGLTAPTCPAGSNSLSDGNNSPGTYTSFDTSPSDSAYLQPGIYCITDDSVTWQGDITSDQTDGVFLYFDGTNELNSVSQPNINLYALTNDDSDYTNLLMWFDDPTASPSNSTVVDMSAGSSFDLQGTIYAPRKHCNLAGQADGIIYAQFVCYSFDGNGGSNIVIIFDPSRIYSIPGSFGVTE